MSLHNQAIVQSGLIDVESIKSDLHTDKIVNQNSAQSKCNFQVVKFAQGGGFEKEVKSIDYLQLVVPIADINRSAIARSLNQVHVVTIFDNQMRAVTWQNDHTRYSLYKQKQSIRANLCSKTGTNLIKL